MFTDLVREDAFRNTFKKIMIKEDAEKEAAIKEADTDGAVELTLRVAFGKMVSKISSNSAGKVGSERSTPENADFFWGVWFW